MKRLVGAVALAVGLPLGLISCTAGTAGAIYEGHCVGVTQTVSNGGVHHIFWHEVCEVFI